MWQKVVCDAIIQYADPRALASHLCQKGLLDMKDIDFRSLTRPKDSEEFMVNFVDTLPSKGPDAHSRFEQCIKDSHDHLGHCYITSLLEGWQFADDRIIHLSADYRKRFTEHMPEMTAGINVRCLLPHMAKHKLVTLKEMESLGSVEAMVLFSVLETKGPTAHYLFAQCLDEETTHPRHKELYHLLLQDAVDSGEKHPRKRENNPKSTVQHLAPPSPKRRTPGVLYIEEHLTGEEYTQRRHRFESYYHNGHWAKVDEEARKCKDSNVLDIQAIGLLETALSWIFRGNKKITVQLIKEAQTICQRIETNNSIFLQGRCEYLLSLLYRYRKNYKKAKRHIREARSILCDVEPGEDKSFANYCDGVIAAECLSEDSSPHEVEKVQRLFERAIDYASYSENVDSLVIHSYLQLARLHLGTTHTQLRVTEDYRRIKRARDCLETLQCRYEHLDVRCRSLFHLSQSDLHRSCGEVQQAIESATQAEHLASEGDFPMEIEAAKIRKEFMQKTLTSHA